MPPSDRHQLPLRLPHDLASWVQLQARRRQTSANAYILGILRDKYEADGAKHRVEKGLPKKDRDTPRGLGLRQDPPFSEEGPEPLASAEPAAPVVVNVGGAGSGTAAPGDLVQGLAAHIAAGPAWERERRHRQALDVLKSACPSPAARKDAEERLQAALREQDRERRGAPAIGTIGSLFRQ